MDIVTIETAALGNRTYVVVDGDVGAVIDPQRDIDRIEAVLGARGVTLRYVLETHLHNDYVTGGLELARRTGAAYVVAAAEDVSFERTSARDGDEFPLHTVVLRALHTPGHTPNHMAYIAVEGARPVASFTGGSMLYGTVGRTDLISADSTDALTRAQFQSVRRLAGSLPDDATVHPTHGFGSFCSSGSTSGADVSTIAVERASNLAMVMDDEDAFVERLLGGLTAYPLYYAHMAVVNRAGPGPVDLSPPEPVDAAAVRRRIHAGEWVVDLRDRAAFARAHVAGTVNIEVGSSFTTYLGWTLPWGTPVTLVGDTKEQVVEAQRQLVRIAIDRPAGAADGGVDSWGRGGEIRSFRRASFGDLADAAAASSGGMVVLDVRRDDEWVDGHIDGAVHVPLHELEARLTDVPAGEVWVHCASGYRAAIAGSLLDRARRQVVVVDDEWAAAAKHDALRVGVGDG